MTQPEQNLRWMNIGHYVIPALLLAGMLLYCPACRQAGPKPHAKPDRTTPEIIAILPPAVPPQDEPAHVFSISNSAKWKITNKGETRLNLREENGVVYLGWPGGPGSATAEFMDEAPVKPYQSETEDKKENWVRYVCFANILQSEYGHEALVELQAIKQDGATKGDPYISRPPYAGSGGISHSTEPNPYAKPGEWARIDFGYKCAPDICGIRPHFSFRGNAVTLAVGQIFLTKGVIRKFARPEIETEPRAFDQDKVADLLEQRKPAVPKLEKRPGRVALTVNGEDVFPAIYTRGGNYPKYTRYGDFTRAGFNLFHLPLKFGMPSPPHLTAVGPLWLGKDRYNFARLEEELKVIFNINPEALVILNAGIGPYHGWAQEHPGSVFSNREGKWGVDSGGEDFRYGGKPDYTYYREQEYAPTLYGGDFPRDASNAVKALAQWLATNSAGKIVIGVDLNGGNDGQWFPWDRDSINSGADHSPSAVKAWRAFLGEIYAGNENALRQAWGNADASFGNAGVPSPEARGYLSKSPTRAGIDYNEFVNQALADFILGLANGLKDGSNGRLLAGVYYPDAGYNGGQPGKCAVRKMLASPYFDCMRSVMMEQLAGSMRLHNKFYMCEMDIRNPRSNMLGHTEGLDYPYHVFQQFAWRHAARSVADKGGAYYHYDMAEGWYCDVEVVNFFGTVRSGLAKCLSDAAAPQPVIGVFIDERIALRKGGENGDHRLMSTAINNTTHALARSGVPYARYIIDELFDEKFTLPKICLLPAPMCLTPEQGKFLREKARKGGNILIWGYGPGVLDFSKPDVRHICGFDAVTDEATRYRQIRIDGESSPLTRGLEGKLLGKAPEPMVWTYSYRWPGLSYVVKPEPGDKVLGHYAGTALAGAVWRDQNGLRELFVGFPGAFPPQLLRNLARLVDEEPFAEDDEEVCLNNGILYMYAEKGGLKKITLPRVLRPDYSPTGHKFEITPSGFVFETGCNETAVFRITKAQ